MNRMLRKTWIAAAVIAGSLGFGSAADAAVYLIDFGGSSTNPTAGGTWNIIKDTTATSGDSPVGPLTTTLVDTSGSNTANVQFQITDDFIDNHGTQGSATTTPTAAWVDTNALGDYLLLYTGISNTTGAFQFNNLDDNWSYSIELVSARDTTGSNRKVQASANGDAPDNFPTGVIDAAGNKTVAVWAELIPVDGTITMNFSTVGASDFAYINALRLTQVEPVPEPATIGLLTFAGLALSRRRQRA